MEGKRASEFVLSLLRKRGVTDEKAVAAFLNPDYDLHTHDPMLLAGIEAALARLFAAMEAGERIAVYADFDCDGIPGAAILHDFFKKIGYENFEVYLPHRDREGYGLHESALGALADRGVKLVITVDVGTNAREAVAFARSRGVDVIVTDHHEITGELPEAVAVVNPKVAPPASSGAEGYPFAHLCGAAVAWKLAQAALREGKRRALASFLAVPDGWEKWLLDLVAIATIADMVPLMGENRVLARYGLSVLRKSRRPGIDALCGRARIRKADLTEDDVGFSIAPRLNAASRMDDPELAFRLLATDSPEEAASLAAQLETLNAARKGVVAGIVREAKKRVQKRFTREDRVAVLGDISWKPALLGLAANSLLQERGGLVCLWGRDASGRLKGSCRSDGSVSVVAAFSAAAETFEEFGGHERSGGFSVSHERVHGIAEALALSLPPVPPVPDPAPEPDQRLALSEAGERLFADLSALAPFGIGNPKPLFRIEEAVVSACRTFGKEKNHVEVEISCARTGRRMRAFDFFRSPEGFSVPPRAGVRVALLATLERDAYRRDLALRLADILPPEVENVHSPSRPPVVG